MKAITEQNRRVSARRLKTGPWWRRLAWFVALWVMSVATVGAVAMLLHWVLSDIK